MKRIHLHVNRFVPAGANVFTARTNQNGKRLTGISGDSTLFLYALSYRYAGLQQQLE
jgi:hypothetical protein